MKKEEFIQKIAGYVKKYAAAYEIKVCSPIIAQPFPARTTLQSAIF